MAKSHVLAGAVLIVGAVLTGCGSNDTEAVLTNGDATSSQGQVASQVTNTECLSTTEITPDMQRGIDFDAEGVTLDKSGVESLYETYQSTCGNTGLGNLETAENRKIEYEMGLCREQTDFFQYGNAGWYAQQQSMWFTTILYRAVHGNGPDFTTFECEDGSTYSIDKRYLVEELQIQSG